MIFIEIWAIQPFFLQTIYASDKHKLHKFLYIQDFYIFINLYLSIFKIIFYFGILLLSYNFWIFIYLFFYFLFFLNW